MDTEHQNHKIYKRNLILFLVSYLISNIVAGIAYDVYVNYLQEIAPGVAMSFWSYYGYSAFIGAILILLAPKVGYKNLLICAVLMTILAFFASVYFKWEYVYHLSTLLLLSGIQLHYVLLSPFFARYAVEHRIKWFARAYYIGYLGYFLATYAGGALLVKIFSHNIHSSYSHAQELTRYTGEMSPDNLVQYLKSYDSVLLGMVALCFLSFIPIFMIRESQKGKGPEKNFSWLAVIKNLNRVINSDSLVYLLYWTLINFGMGLFTPYFTIYLNRYLHIDKATSSLLISISYIAIVLFVFFTPYFVKKFGQIFTLAAVCLGSIPFMFIIANGNNFGNYQVYIVGMALFMRAGLANLGSPIDSALSMELIAEEYREVYASLISFVASFGSILSGQFTGNYLFLQPNGYKQAYYIAAGLYTVACILIMLKLMKYNRTSAE